MLMVLMTFSDGILICKVNCLPATDVAPHQEYSAATNCMLQVLIVLHFTATTGNEAGGFDRDIITFPVQI